MSLLVNEIGPINIFFYQYKFQPRLGDKGVLYVNFQNSDISTLRGDAGTTFESTQIDENSKRPPFFIFHFWFCVKSVKEAESHKEHSTW